MTQSEKALKLHEEWNGKITTTPKCEVKSREDLAIAYMHLHLREQRGTDLILAADRINRIESHGGKDIPSGHLAAILIADDAFRRGLVHLVQQATGPFLCLPRLAHIAI